MNLEELRSVRRAERQKDSLQHLRDEFYEEVAAYIAQLKHERERAVAAADDPFASEEVRRLTDEVESAKEDANALYERRVGKVVKHASFAAADMATDEEGMTVEERELFDDLVERIRENRRSVLATIEGDGTRDDAPTAGDPAVERGTGTDEGPSTTDAKPKPDPEQGTRDDARPEAEPTALGAAESRSDDELLSDALGDTVTADRAAPDSDARSDRPTDEATVASTGPDRSDDGHEAPGAGADAPDAVETGADTDTDPRVESGSEPGSETETGSETEPETERTTLRITRDVGTIYCVDDREYELAREDVVTLPTVNAEPILQQDAAERID
jgi:DNA replication factor GINS